MTDQSKKRFNSAIVLMKRGGSLLRETCPKCGGLQVKYFGNVYCVNCSDLENVITAEITTNSNIMFDLRQLILRKMKEAMDLLDKETNIEKQTQIITLIIKYHELIEKVDKERKSDDEKKDLSS